jgi:hypothetical protein
MLLLKSNSWSAFDKFVTDFVAICYKKYETDIWGAPATKND